MCLVDLAKHIIRISQSKSKIEYRKLPIDDPKQRRPDISRAKKYLKWQAGVVLEDGLARTIEWFRQN